MIWHTHVTISDAVKFIAAVVAVSVFLVGFPGKFGDWWKRTFGARHDLTRRLNMLACGADRKFIDLLLGQAVFSTPDETDAHLLRLTYRFQWCWVTVVLRRDSVLAFSVTTTSRRFRYRTFVQTFGTIDVRLGKSLLVDVPGQPESIHAFVGARRYGYQETHWGANPGGYQTFIFGNNALGVKPQAPIEIEMSQLKRAQRAASPDDIHPDKGLVEDYRRTAKANSFSVLGQSVAHTEASAMAIFVEVDQDHVRVFHYRGRLFQGAAFRKHLWSTARRGIGRR